MSLYYYIGDKEQLYAAVWKRLEEQLTPTVSFKYNKDQTAEKNLEKMIRGTAAVSTIVPLHSIALRALFEGGENFPESIVRDIERYFENFSEICKELKGDNADTDAPPAVIAWMVYAFLVYWVVTIPPILKYEGPQFDAIRKVGVDVTNENLIQMVKTLVLRMLNVPEQHK